MKPHEAFLLGYKPAFLGSQRYQADILDELRARKFPNTLHYELEDFDEPGKLFDTGYLFFQNEDLQKQYLDSMNGLELNSREEIILLGKTLGFPPIACEFYVDSNQSEELNRKTATFRYYGRVFGGNIDDATLISIWLWENVPAPPMPVEFTYQDKTTLIDPTASVVVT